MKIRTLTMVLAVALAGSITVATPGFSANDQVEPPATKKMTRQQRKAPRPPAPAYTSRPMTSCDYDRAAGRCVIDLGYGRCMECSVGPR